MNAVAVCCNVDVFRGQVVDLLVSQGADVTMVNHEGQTAVELATTPIIRQLLLAAVDKGGPQHNLCQAAWQGNANVLHRTLVIPRAYSHGLISYSIFTAPCCYSNGAVMPSLDVRLSVRL